MIRNDPISSKQLIYIIIGSQIGVSVFILPRLAVDGARQDAWLAVLLGVLLPFLVLFIIERLGRRLPKSNFVIMNQQLFGRWLGSGIIFLFIFYMIFVQSTIVRIFSELTSVFLLPKTPLPVIMLSIILAAVYIISGGARVIGRLNEILFWVIFPLSFIIFAPLINADYTYLLPVGEAGLAGLSRGILATSTAYAGIEVLLIFYFLVSDKKKVLKAGLLGLAWTCFFNISVTLVCLLVWGSEMITMINWPALTVLNSVEFSFLERPEIFILSVWLAVGTRPVFTIGFAAAYSLSEVLRIDRTKYFPAAAIAIALPIYILALLPKNLIVAFKWSEYAGYFFIFFGLFYPLLMLSSAVIQNKEDQNAG